MRDEPSPEQLALRAEVDRVLAAAGPRRDHREVFARLGEERLLAGHFPDRYGGRDLPLAQQMAVAERIGEHGLPDVVHLVTVQGVGCTVLAFGDEGQRARWLPDIAAGRLFASLLLSETGAGSDPTRVETRAVPDGDGWVVSGSKAWTMYTDWSGVALCSVRTREGRHRYDGISLLMVDLDVPGVRLTPVPRAAGTPYFQVEFDEVRVGADAVIGPLHGGWSLLPTAIGFERGGFDYLSRASSWLRLARDAHHRLPAPERAELAPSMARLAFGVANARALAHHAAHTANGLSSDEVLTAYTKLACGRAAQATARWAGEELGAGAGAALDRDAPFAALAPAVAEAPELTVSGGPQELQLDLIAGEYPIGGAVR
ncbi:acyl-CoA dehydrogenase family protein [Streptomyces sp. rh34]|uniref:acyl-CoA dehydrogenase family protein n=1 Tax=Streptomyces sp. rh34 TaxID=2034272 RepID=UPI000BF139A5|nr:acyl-CoA dehydrogenase family protein [Streptomyces sp. rh34]